VVLYSSYVSVCHGAPSELELRAMGKRKPVPAALYSEFTEYSSLIRALRTSNSLDVTSHITKPRPYSVRDDSELESDGDLSGSPNNAESSSRLSNVDLPESAFHSRDISPAVSGPSSSVEPPSKTNRKRKRNSTTPSRPRRRDVWTRWPLLANDVYIPEWSLEDEIGILAANALKLHPRPPLPVLRSESSTPSSDDEDTEDQDSQADGDAPSYLPPLTNAASNYLSTILALLVAHTPNRPQSQQNRIEPIGWQAVLNILSSCGDPSVANQKCVFAPCFSPSLKCDESLNA
jgi:hypothetical protein